MEKNKMMKHFTSVRDVGHLPGLLEKAREMKSLPFAHENLGRQKTMVLLFFNASLRTRLSTQKAARNLGLDVIVMNINEDSWKIETGFGVVMDGKKAEHIKEAAGVIGRYCNILGVRSFANLQDKDNDYAEPVINQFIQYAGVPVVSMESATGHPLQAFADMITIEQYKNVKRPRVVLTWAPHPNALPQAVPNSFAEWSLSAGYDLVIAHPEGYELDESFTRGAEIQYNQEKAFEGADFIYAKNWSSVRDYGKVLHADKKWMVTMEKMKRTREAKFMHCLPVRRNMVVEDAVIDSPSSVVIEQAANRVVSAQTVIAEILNQE
jgi:N-succinyl-L-ornithine transcarbamylase